MTYKGSSAGQLWRAGHREQELGELVTRRKGPDCWSQGARVWRAGHREEGLGELVTGCKGPENWPQGGRVLPFKGKLPTGAVRWKV